MKSHEKTKKKKSSKNLNARGYAQIKKRRQSQSQSKMRMSHQSNHKGQIKKENMTKEKKKKILKDIMSQTYGNVLGL